MNFKKISLSPTYLYIVDIGSYKIRVSACSFLNKRVSILGYTEKRQDTNNFINQECRDIIWLSENINQTLKKLEWEIGIDIEKVVVNFPFGELFVSTKKINYKRDFPHSPLKEEELEKIIQRAESISLRKLSEEIKEYSNLGKDELELILSRMNHVSIDGVEQERILGNEGINVRISLLNIFVPLSKYNLINHLGNIIEKKIVKILPTEFCITKLFQEDSLVIINIWATQTSISIKKEKELIGVSKIGIGINDLLSKISENTHETKIEIIEKLDTGLYIQEKKDFLDIWTAWVLIGIKEIVEEDICPKEFFIFGGGGNNMFMKEALQKLDFHKHDIRIITPLHFLEVRKEEYIWSIVDTDSDIIDRMSLDSIALIIETNNLLIKEKDIVSESLKKVVTELWYNMA